MTIGAQNVLFIDNTVQDYELFVTSVNENTFPIVYSITSTKEEILALLNTFTKIDRIGFVFSSISAEFLDKPFTDNVDFFISVIQDFNLKNMDYLACNTLNYSEWVNFYTLLNATGVIIGASNDLTGNIKYGGDWVMESTSEDIEFIYFTKSIEYYSYLLDSTSEFTIMIKPDGLYGTGYNIYGQLGLGNTTIPITTLTPINTYNKTPKYISGGGFHTIVLMTDGTLYGTGYNIYGQLGLGNTTTPITTLKPINTYNKTPKYISCGGYHTIVLMTDGTLYGTGNNGDGQLGLGNRTTPITTLTSINTYNKTPKYISCGVSHTIVLMTDGTLYGTGRNTDGQLGLNSTTNPITTLTSINTYNKTPNYISCAGYHTIVLMTDGTLYGTGFNGDGQLGLGNTTRRITTLTSINTYNKTPNYISCGSYHTIVLMTDETLYGTGYNFYGQLGLGNTTTSITTLTFMLNATNVIYVAGMISEEDIPSPNFTIIIKTDGLYGTGLNNHGQLGLNNTTSPITTLTSIDTYNNTPKYISCGFNHTIVLMTDGTLYGTGRNAEGQLGLNNITNPITTLTFINTYNKTPKYISCGARHSIVLMTDGTLYGTGRNAEGQLGLNNITNPITTLTFIDTDNKTPNYISCGFSHTIVLMTDGTLYGTGRNAEGQLGLNNTTSPITTLTSIDTYNKTPKYISCGFNHTIVLMTDGTLYGTGFNDAGQLGLNNTITAITLTSIDTYNKIPNYISCGSEHTIVLMTDGTLYGTGLNIEGQLGLNNTITAITLTSIDTYNKIPNYISCGPEHTIVLMTDGTLYGTGRNTEGTLGLNNTTSPITTLTFMLNATNVIYVEGMISEDIPSSNICFPAGTPVQTDQGIISIENIRPFIHTIGMKPIVDITKTVSQDKYLVGFKKNALGLNYPNDNTLISKEHKILYKGKLREAKYFLDKFENVVKVKYNGEVLYNVLMEEHSQMSVNQLICETLHPNNIIAKLYTNQFKYSDDVRDKISIILKKCIRKKDYKTYNKIINHC